MKYSTVRDRMAKAIAYREDGDIRKSNMVTTELRWGHKDGGKLSTKMMVIAAICDPQTYQDAKTWRTIHKDMDLWVARIYKT